MDSHDPMEIYHRLSKRFGDLKWWPADSPFEVMVGAVLTQQTNWKNVEISISNLKNADLLNINPLASASLGTIRKCIKPSGFYKQKTQRIKNLARFLVDNYEADLNKFFQKDADTQRKELLSLKGIGPETADSILLYADSKLKFVVDAYTFRIFKRLGLNFQDNYEKAQEFFENRLSKDLYLYRNFHALLVELGKNHCKIKPICHDCPLFDCCTFHQNLK
ncbi:MAG: hypothetical protein JSV56_05640 [Methanomassiliicoccales archaeon]|nr:MAG: hypothetical protein JSV56_05640 [Methanomassiliicoccales archaeon]